MATAADPADGTNNMSAVDSAQPGETQQKPAQGTTMGHASAGVLLITEKENALPRPAGSSVRKKGRSSKNSQLRRATRQVDHRGNEALALRIVDSNAAAPLESQEESFDAPAPRAGASTPEDDSKRPAVERQESSHEYAATGLDDSPRTPTRNRHVKTPSRQKNSPTSPNKAASPTFAEAARSSVAVDSVPAADHATEDREADSREEKSTSEDAKAQPAVAEPEPTAGDLPARDSGEIADEDKSTNYGEKRDSNAMQPAGLEEHSPTYAVVTKTGQRDWAAETREAPPNAAKGDDVEVQPAETRFETTGSLNRDFPVGDKPSDAARPTYAKVAKEGTSAISEGRHQSDANGRRTVPTENNNISEQRLKNGPNGNAAHGVRDYTSGKMGQPRHKQASFKEQTTRTDGSASGGTEKNRHPSLRHVVYGTGDGQDRNGDKAPPTGGIRYAPWNVPLKRRLQTLAVLFHSVCIGFCLALFWFLCAIPLMWPLLFWYLVHVIFSKDGFDGSLRRRSPWLRSLRLWTWFADYFPARLHKTADLPPTRKYILGYHPHGIISHGAWVAFGTEALGFSDKFPGITNSLVTLDSNFRTPLYRDWVLAMGLQSVSKDSITNILTRGGRNGEGMGRAVTIVVGGARESLAAQPGTMQLVLRCRKGFVKLAARTGADLVPVIAFGENDLYHQLTADTHPRLHRLQMWILKVAKFTLPFLHGRGIFNYDVGLMPYRRPLNVVVGRPIKVVQQRGGDVEPAEVDRLHGLYMDALRDLWDEYKDRFARDRKEEMQFLA